MSLELKRRAMARLKMYDLLSDEYYIQDKHPTSFYLRECSKKLLKSNFGKKKFRRAIEVGAGKSVLPEILDEYTHYDDIILVDKNIEMLSYSFDQCSENYFSLVGSNDQLPFRDESFDVFFSCLGDPYNCDLFWSEMYRVLIPGGIGLFTSPAFEWAMIFRDIEALGSKNEAVFQIKDGRTVWTKSNILTECDQRRLINKAGLEVLKTSQIRPIDMEISAPPKISSIIDEETAVVSLYEVARP